MNNFTLKMLSRQRRYMSLLWLITLFFSINSPVKAQTQIRDTRTPSPNAASLGLYGEMPVSLYTGIPNIDIPIYTIKEGKIEIPISLSYHASGVRVNQHTGWTGLNWTLNAGGAITRVIKGGNDEASYVDKDNVKVGYYYRNGALSADNWRTIPGMVHVLSEKIRLRQGYEFDTEPDEFDFNFLGYSGKFYRNHSGGWAVKSDVDMRVEDIGMLDVPSGMDKGLAKQQMFGGFVLTTGDGMKFYFGGNTSAIEYNTSFFEQNKDIWVANTWNLVKIESPEGEEVTFTYGLQPEGKFIASFSTSFQAGSTGYSFPFATDGRNFYSSNLYTGTLIRPVYLARISFSKGFVDFTRSNTTELKYPGRVLESFADYVGTSDGESTVGTSVKYLTDAFTYMEPREGSGWSGNLRSQIPKILDKFVWQKLINISVTQNSGSKVIQSVDLNYNDDPDKRLMLKGVSFKVGTCKNNYGFTYYNESSLPEYFDEYDQTDHWGFYNGNQDFKHADINLNQAGYVAHKDASSNINLLNAGSIDTLRYPAGGFTKFVYEPHTFYKYKTINPDGSFSLASASGKKVGGIRIKEIEHNDGQNSTSKAYSYTWGNGSSGIGNAMYEYKLLTQQRFYDKDGKLVGTFAKDIFSVNNTLPLSPNSLGSHIGYREVKETNADGSYSIYKYTNYESEDGAHMDEFIPESDKFGSGGNIYDPQIDKSLERGKLLFQEDYDANGIVAKKSLTYKKVSDGFVRAVKTNTFMISTPGGSIESFFGMPYGYHTYQYRVDTETQDIFDGANRAQYVRDRTTYSYNKIGLATQVLTERGSQSKRVVNKYVYDYLIPSVPTEKYAASINAMKTIGMNNVLVEQQIWHKENGTEGMVDGNVNLFLRYSAKSGYNNIQLEKTYRLASVAPETSIQTSDVKSTGFSYDNAKYSHLILDFGTDPAAGYTPKGEPKQFKESDGIWTYFNWHVGDKAGLMQSKRVGSHETTFEYADPLVGVSRINNLNLGTFTDYAYDEFNRLATVKDYLGNLVESYTYNLKNSTGCDAMPKLVPSAIMDPVPDTDENGNQCTANLVKLLYRTADRGRLAGATIQGSQNGVDWEVLYQFPDPAPADGSWVRASFSNPQKYPHIRYNARAGSDGVGDLREIRFYYLDANGNEYALSGTGFGSEPNISNLGWQNALDGNEATAWHAEYVPPLGHPGNSNFVGISLPCATTLITPILYKSTSGDVCADGSPITLTASGFSGQLEWYLNDVLITGTQPGQTRFIATIAGNYKVRSKSGSSYSSFSNTIVLNQKSGCVNNNQCTANLVKLLYRTADRGRLAGATIQGSSNGVDWEVLYQFPDPAPADGSWVRASFSNPQKYPHIRYNARAGSDGVGDLREIRFYYLDANGNEYALSGTGFGSEPNISNLGWQNALDGNEATAWHAEYVPPLGHPGNSNFVGISLPCATTLITPILYKSTSGDVCSNGSPITLTASGFSGQLEWYLNDVLITGAQPGQTQYIATIAGTYKVRSKSGSSYSSFSNTMVLNQKAGCDPTNGNQCTANLVKLLWRNYDHVRLAEATIQGSPNGVDWYELYKFPLDAVAPAGTWFSQSFNNPNKYPHIRYNARPNTGVGDLKEIRFYYRDANGSEYALSGTGFGSEPNLLNQGWAMALDGNETTQWHAEFDLTKGGHPGNSNFVGISLPCATTLITPILYKSTSGDVCSNGSPITLTASGFSGQLEWYLNDVLITGTQQGQTQYIATLAGTYKVRSKSGSSYSGFSNTIVLNQKSGCAPPNYSRVVIVGNSITKLIPQSGSDGWQSPALSAAGGWGRASSTQAKDFAHILEARFKQLDPSAQVLPLWEAPFERDYISSPAGWVTYNFTALQNRIANSFGSSSWKPDLVIIRLGENVLDSEVELNNFKGAYNTLINKVLEVSSPGAKVILTNSMWPDQPTANIRIQQVATERGLSFVDLSDMISNPVYLAGNDPVSMAAFPNNTGDRHPGDAGMLEIADRIWSKVTNTNLPSNVGGNITKVRLSPRTQCCIERITGSVIQGSNDISNANGWTTLVEIKDTLVAGWNEYAIRTTTNWRYVRFLAGPKCFGELKELEFYNGNVKLTGTKFGSPAAYNNDPANYGYGVAFDGLVTNSWHGTIAGPTNYAGLDLGANCSTPTASILSPANNASVVGTASPGTPGNVITAISVTTCVPSGTSINRVEIWAKTAEGLWPNKMGNAIVDASQPGVYKLLAQEGSADGKWLAGYLAPGTYRFWAKVVTSTGEFEDQAAYNLITITAPPVTGCASPTARVLSPANNASVVGTASPGTPGNVITAISVTTCVPSGTSITRVEIWAKTAEGLWPNKMGNAIVDASQPGVYKLLAQEGPADGKWLAGYLAPGTYRFWAKVVTSTGEFEDQAAYNLITITAPPVTGCASPTARVLSPANNASVVGTASPGTPGNVITAISVTTCVPSGTSINRVEIWAKTAEGLWPNKMGNAIVDASQPGVYKLLAQEGSADGKWLAGYLAPGTYRFWAKVVTSTGEFEDQATYNLITITAPPVTGCASPTARVLSPANNGSVVGTASPGTPGNVITAISVTTCVPSGTSITRVEIWAKTAEGLWPNKMGNAIVDASQPGVYKLLAQEGPADGKWLAGYLAPGTYRFWAKVVTSTGEFEDQAAYNLITITAP